MNLLRLAIRSLAFYKRSHGAVVLAVAAATAAITGALLMGDSMQESLRHLALDRLGKIESVTLADHFFGPELTEQITGQTPTGKPRLTAPSILVQGSAERPAASGNGGSRASDVTILGCDDSFAGFSEHGDVKIPGPSEVILNEKLAGELGAKIGDYVLVRIGRPSDIPADSPLGRKSETTRSMRLKVAAIMPQEGLGSFSLRPSQLRSASTWVARDTLAAALEQPGKVNAIFANFDFDRPLYLSLADAGLSLHEGQRGVDYLSSERMMLSPAVARNALKALKVDQPQPAFTYLANYILAGDGRGKIPYSTITAVDLATEPPLGPFLDREGRVIEPIGENEIVLNAWAADDLAAQGVKLAPGDAIRLQYFQPESLHGKVEETETEFRLKAIVAMDGPATDPDWTPEFKGITDKNSIVSWNPPFTFYSDRVRSTPPNNQDDAYWKKYRALPKAFINLAAGRRLWGSRFGNTTSIRFVAPQGMTADKLAARLDLNSAAAGFQTLPLRQIALAASGGSTPFDGLFLGFSFFLIAAALMLVGLLFRLGVEQRSSEIGLLLALGFRPRQIVRLQIGEGLLVSAIGGVLGVALGIAYARLLVAGLNSPRLWLEAIRSPVVQLAVSPQSLLIGVVSGVLTSMLAIAWTVRRVGRAPAARLLAGGDAEPTFAPRSGQMKRYIIAILFALGAVALGLFARELGGEAQAGAFFGAGALALAALLLGLSARLRGVAPSAARRSPARLPLLQLAGRSAARNAGRATMVVGLVASATFLIVAVSVFRLDPLQESVGKNSGSGGYSIIARSDQPIYQNLNDSRNLEELGVSEGDQKKLAAAHVEQLRLHAGEDASCLNLYQASTPDVIGVPPSLIERGGFAWRATVAKDQRERENPWLLLDKKLPPVDGREVTPIVLDESTALYSLHLGGYHGPFRSPFQILDGHGVETPVQVVGLLGTSVFQGKFLMSEANFLRLFPETSGYRMFLVETHKEDTGVVESLLEKDLSDFGFDATLTRTRIAELVSVENTYLFAFQSLGALGLLLGTFGLAAVELRTIWERRGELALMRAIGFSPWRLAALVALENGLLLAGGLAVGSLAALVAVAPHLFGAEGSIDWRTLSLTLAGVLAVGLAAAWLAARAALRADLLPALRGR